MKRAILLFTITGLLFSACITNKPGIYHYVYDLRAYEKEGFLFSSNDYKGKYKAVGVFTTDVIDQYNKPYTSNQYLSEIMTTVKDMGGDALINLKITPLYDKYNHKIGTKVSGFAIKRID